MSDLRKTLPVFALVGDGHIKMDERTKQLEIYNDKESARRASGYVVDELSIKEVDIEKYGEVERLQAKLTAKDDQIERMRERGRWIPVSERLPEPDVLVLVWFGKLEHKDSDIKFDTDYVDVCPISGNEFFINFGEDITHWKPITPPTDKG